MVRFSRAGVTSEEMLEIIWERLARTKAVEGHRTPRRWRDG